MGRKPSPGLRNRNGTWHIDKTIRGRRIRVSCETSDLEEAERLLSHILETHRKTSKFGERPVRSFADAAVKFVTEHEHKRSLEDDISRLKHLMPFIGAIPIERITMDTLKPWIDHRRQERVSTTTINHGLQVVRHILNLAAFEWHDDNGLSWLERAPRIKLFPVHDRKEPHPLSWSEQDRLFHHLPDHLREMATFGVNTGCRDREICGLQWAWEQRVESLGTSVFIVPGAHVKNGRDRLIVLNTLAMDVVDRNRGKHSSHVFAYKSKPILRMLNSAWLRARKAASLPDVRVHDLKHTFGRRLRAAGVDFETRQDLLGHKSSRITTHYSGAELANLLKAANSIVGDGSSRPELVILKLARESQSPQNSRKSSDFSVTKSANLLKSLVAEERYPLKNLYWCEDVALEF